MKFSLIAAVVVLALAQGSYAQDAAAAPDLASLGRYFEELKNKMVQDLTEIVRTQDFSAQAQTFATQLQEQMQTAARNMEEQVKPLAASAQTNLQPQIQEFQKQMEAIFQKLTGQAQAVGN